MQFLTLISLAAFCGAAAALPRDNASALVPRDCSSQAAAFNFARRERRGHAKRATDTTATTLTCIAAPEAPLKDYATPAERPDVREGQTGLELTLDIGVIDVTTCQPLQNAMVEVWSANALGVYGSFLRGAAMSTTDGVAEFQTIFPGFTSDGANHINLMVHTSDSMSSTISHVGQLFFTDRWTDVVSQTSPYNQNSNARVSNAQDPDYATASAGGYNAIVDIESIHDDWPEGVIGFITVGVNPQREVNVDLN